MMIKIRLFLYLFFFLSLFLRLSAQEIINTVNPEGWILQTDNSVYQMTVSNNKVEHVFYGQKDQFDCKRRNTKWAPLDEIPVRGGLPYKTPVIEVVFSDGVRDLNLVYDSYQITNDNGIPLLKIVQKDSHYPFEVTSYFKVYKEFDIIEKWISVTNTDKENKVLIENLLSGSVNLPADKYILTQFSGRYMNEFQIEQAHLTTGLKVIQSKGFKSNENAPWFMVQTSEATKSDGSTWFGSLHYSGNWGLVFEQKFDGTLQITGGVNFWDSNWTLFPGQSFISPKITFGYSNRGTDNASVNLANYIRSHVLPSNFRDELRPVLYNSWEATHYDVNEQQQIKLADVAKEIGVELFVVDDGWFKDRTDGRSQSGLGNFDVDTHKFPNGLKPLIDHVHGLGMKFGLWVEPENVNPNSDIYRKHPEWVFQFPNREGNKFRKILNLANEGAYGYLLSSLTNLLENNDIDFIKWDQNNHLSEPGWQEAPQGLEREARIRHTENVYRLVDELRKKFPDVLFETCASGGGRVDLGMLSRMDQAWLSDNTDPIDRLFIQHGYAKMLPANTMVSWVTSMARHQTMPLEYRFDVSMTGVLGIGADITTWNDEEKEIARKKIEQYKNIRGIVQKGDHYSLISPFETNRSASQYVTHDKNFSLLFCFNMAYNATGSQFIERGSKSIQLMSLRPDSMYIVKDISENKEIGRYTGSFLMNIGLNWPVENRTYKSKILLLETEI